MSVTTKEDRRLSRRRRVRAKISGTGERPRISVFRSNRGICAQLIDDDTGRTVAAVQWYEPELRTLTKAERATRAVNENRRPPLTTLATRLISTTRSCRSSPAGFTERSAGDMSSG